MLKTTSLSDAQSGDFKPSPAASRDACLNQILRCNSLNSQLFHQAKVRFVS